MSSYKSLLCLILQIVIAMSVPAPTPESIPEIFPVILYGTPVRIEDYPFFASTETCGGAIISDRWILTAAHCVDTDKEINDKRVYVGGESKDNSNLVKFKRALRHPGYSQNPVTINDIALLELETPLQFSSKVQPVKLPRALTSSLHLVSLGRGDDETGRPSVTLKKMDSLRLNPNECINNFRPHGLNVDKQLLEQSVFCTTRAEGQGPGICFGDSGSPVVENDMIIGVTSFLLDPGNKRNCFNSYFAGYTNVAAYMQWITSVTGLM